MLLLLIDESREFYSFNFWLDYIKQKGLAQLLNSFLISIKRVSLRPEDKNTKEVFKKGVLLQKANKKKLLCEFI